MSSKIGTRAIHPCQVEGCRNRCSKTVCGPCGFRIRTGALPEQHGVTLNPRCEVQGCQHHKQTRKRPYCATHQKFAKTGADMENLSSERSTQRSQYRRITKACSVEGCSTRTRWEFCAHHASQQPQSDDNRRCRVPQCENYVKPRYRDLCGPHRGELNRRGLTIEEYLEWMSVTSCQSCEGEGKPLVFDHDHACPNHDPKKMCRDCIRGRICGDCNIALGFLRDSLENAKGLVRYISTFD